MNDREVEILRSKVDMLEQKIARILSHVGIEDNTVRDMELEIIMRRSAVTHDMGPLREYVEKRKVSLQC